MSVAKAAALAGVTERTMRNRTAAGRYPTRLVGGKMQVLIAEDTEEAPVGDRSASELDAEAFRLTVETFRQLLEAERLRADEAHRHLDDERERRGQAEQAAAIHQERSRNLETEVQRLSAQLALPAPVHEPTSPPDPVAALRSEVELLRARLEVPRAPWWRIWRRG